MKNFLFFLCSLLILSACNFDKSFTVNGKIENAAGKTLYLEANGLSRIETIDSVKLNENGKFKFKHKAPAYPEFYRLKVDNKIINLSIDSSETVTVEAPLSEFSTAYKVSGSDNCEKIRIITDLGSKLSNNLDKFKKLAVSKQISEQIYNDTIMKIVNEYKTNVKQFIFENPKSSAAYFALLQRVRNLMVFDPYDKDDYKAFGAVATAYNFYLPESLRSKNLYNQTIEALKYRKSNEFREAGKGGIITTEKNHIEINLPDIKGSMRSLSSLTGKVVIIDFTAYQSNQSAPHNMKFGELYEKYASKGLEIYQVSLDNDMNFWQVSASNLPWVCVRDANAQYSQIASSYNVKELPTYFIMNREGLIIKRNTNVKNLDMEIQNLL